ncbi:MAG: YgfZ/GcvT domain-containing protein, partial [Planctomycetota bacterium]
MDLAFFDRTARGRLLVGGHDAKDLLHRLSTNDVLGLRPGAGRPACFCTNKGRLIDATVILDRGEDLLVLSGNPDRLSGHIQSYTISEDVTVRNYLAIELVVCGPGAAELLGVRLEPWHHTQARLGEVSGLVARIEPWMGEGYTVLAPDAVALRKSWAERGRFLQGADVEELRIRSGIPAVPREINEEHNPWEARLDDWVSLSKGCYVGQEV